MIKPTKKDIGKRVVFKAATRNSFTKATRTIIEVHERYIAVNSYAGWRGFYVRNWEIIEILES